MARMWSPFFSSWMMACVPARPEAQTSAAGGDEETKVGPGLRREVGQTILGPGQRTLAAARELGKGLLERVARGVACRGERQVECATW